MTSRNGSAPVGIIIGLVVLLIGSLGFIFWQNFMKESDTPEKTNAPAVSKDIEAQEAYAGTYTTGGNFQVKIPNGWAVDAGAYENYVNSQIILLAGPNKLEALKYSESSNAVINGLAGFGWDGLTEHFYIISQENFAKNYADYEKLSFVLEDGTKGEKYSRVVSKGAQKEMDVFQKDADSYTFSSYEFKKGDVTVSAYLNYYSNTSFDVVLGEKVIRSIKF